MSKISKKSINFVKNNSKIFFTETLYTTMRFIKNNNCQNCLLKCDIYFTAKEMGFEDEINPVCVQYKKHEIICKQNETVTQAIIILEGNAKVFIDGINDKKIILNILVESNYIGLLSVFGAPNYSYNIGALNNCTTCNVDIEVIKKMYYNNHNFLLKLNRAFVESVSNILGKLISLNQKQVRGKVADSIIYLSELCQSNKFDLMVSRKELAELSAISEENAVRVLTEFKNDGIIQLNNKEIEILNFQLLKRISIIG